MSEGVRIAITHRFELRFERAARLPTHWLRLRPAPHTHSRITAYSLAIGVEPHFLNWVRDPFENYLARLDLPEPLKELPITLEVVAELEPCNPFDFLVEPYAAEHPFRYPPQLHKELEPYLGHSQRGPYLRRWFAELDREASVPAPTLERLTDLNTRVAERHRFLPGTTPAVLDPERVLERGAGTCWELAWLLTTSLRHLGLAARFACGYRVVLADDAGSDDSVTLHTWTEVYLPGAGWVGLDPSSGLFTGEGHIPLSCTPDPMSARPIVDAQQNHSERWLERLRVRRLLPAPATWPYTETQWSEIEALGRHVESDLAAQGLRLTAGTSVTFVSGPYADAPEWNYAALGASKRAAAEDLLEGLRQRLAPGGVLQLGQGLWYGGESLPRWRLSCVFRADGLPVWHDAARLARTRQGAVHGLADLAGARAFGHALADQLGVDPELLVVAHEDPLHALWERRASSNASGNGALGDPEGRRALAEQLSADAPEAAGYVLPIRWDHGASRFVSGRWAFRRSGLFLSPGDSPLGYRLPLGSLVRDPEGEREAQLERSPFEERPALPAYAPGRQRAAEAPFAAQPSHPPRTALCVQPRDGVLYVFVPPLSHVEHYLELVAAIEGAAGACDVAVRLEGYEPPEDPRLLRLTLEPEAGVLRLTLPQVGRWDEQLQVLQAGYEEARQVGLRAERLTDDGERLPVDGGSRVALGGPRPAESPFLLRPQILRGLIAYFQRHPCLSYLFAGRLIGDGGHAPRPDEGRDETPYELSIALCRLSGERERPPWYADRVLRHLLTDPAGNLKRAEIRIDELYAPERASGRQGRVVVGAFETAPEERTAALQTLLLYGLLGRFARIGDDGSLIRWGGALHDRFMLPLVLWQDLGAVVADLEAAGYPFQREWFEPILARRFPLLGRVQIGPIELTLQSAHEPWPLLAEEVTGGGVARFLDVANERLQVKLSGLTPGRYLLVCNDRRVPLRASGVRGEYVAGVRFKVWNPPATMHPTRPPVEALIFDVLDSWTGRVIGGCTYYPRPPEVWGPIGSPSVAPRDATGGELPWPPILPPSMAPPRIRRGRFVPRGSGLDALAEPSAHHDDNEPYLLDLTHPR